MFTNIIKEACEKSNKDKLIYSQSIKVPHKNELTTYTGSHIQNVSNSKPYKAPKHIKPFYMV